MSTENKDAKGQDKKRAYTLVAHRRGHRPIIEVGMYDPLRMLARTFQRIGWNTTIKEEHTMSNELTTQAGQSMTAADIRANVNLIQRVMESVMKKGEHYGTIPGCGDKMTLFKSGAEKILSTFRIATEPVVEDLSTPDCARYRVTVRGISQSSGAFLGAGIGEASSDEEKYKWKKAVCNEEWEATTEDRRREKWFKGYNGGAAYQVKQIRTNPADVANTVLKMAKKRGQIDMTLTVTAASDIFTQDIEDEDAVPESGAPVPAAKPPVEMPREQAPTAPAAGGSLAALLAAKEGEKVAEAQGSIKSFSVRTVKGKSGPTPVTDYIVTDGKETAKVSVWGNPAEGAGEGVTAQFTEILISKFGASARGIDLVA